MSKPFWHRGIPLEVEPTTVTGYDFNDAAVEAERPPPTTELGSCGPNRPERSRAVSKARGPALWMVHGLAPNAVAVWLVIGVALIGVWLHGASSGFIPCEQDCGETFDALQYVTNYRLYGLRYWMVQDHATAPWFEAHPYFYTHNVNLAGILFTLLDAVGVKPFWAKQLVTLAGFGAGLAYVYRATTYHTRSMLAGLCVLVLFVTDVQHVLAFGLSPLRAWHWLAIFGLIFHAGRLARQPSAHRRADWIGIAVCALVAFGLGYDFWVICIAVTLIIVGLYRPRDLLMPRRWSIFVGIGLAFIIPFILRQVQIATVLGTDFWMLDIVYSAAIKVPMLNRFVPVPSTDELDAIYRASGILRAPAAPVDSVLAILLVLKNLLAFQLIPSIGLVTFLLAIALSILAVVAAVRLVRLRPRVLLAGLRAWGIRGRARQHVVGTVILIAALVAGVAAGLAFFAPASLHFYLKHEFPLAAAPLLTIKGVVLATLIRSFQSWRRVRRLAAGIVALFLIVDHLIVQTDNVRTLQPMDVSWISAVEARSGETFAVSWIANSVSVFTDTWAVGITPGLEREVSSRISAGLEPFTPSDFFLFGERDADVHTDLYTRPDFWLYYPTDHRIPFDQPAPTCRTDYLTALLQRVGIGRPGSDIEVSPVMASATRVRPGAVLTLFGHVPNNRGRMLQVELIHDDTPIGRTIFNCQAGIFLAEYQIPAESPLGEFKLGARLMTLEGRTFPVGDFQIEVAADAPSTKRLLKAQPTADELIALNPTLPVAERGRDFVLFDLRGLYRDR